MNGLKKIWNFLLLFERAIMIVASITVVVLITTTVVMRYLLEANFPGMEELIILVAFWIYFVGGINGSYENSHITADMLTVFITNKKIVTIIEFIRHILSSVILIGACYCAVELALYTMETSPVSAVLKIPMIVLYLPMLLGIFLMTFYTVVHVVQSGMKLFGKKTEEVTA